mgnify:CR=1 FL=1
MTFFERLARWADKQGWFRVDNRHWLLSDGSVISVSYSKPQLIIRKNGEVIKRIYAGGGSWQ